MPNYSLDAFRRNTERVRSSSARVSSGSQNLATAVDDFNVFFQELESLDDKLCVNVRKLLATKFFNHWYSSLILVEAGLMVDAILCERSSIETLAYHWLVCLDRTAAENYDTEKPVRPVDVRRRLESLGADISYVRSSYSFGSSVGHVGRTSERFHLEMATDVRGTLLIGGQFSQRDCEHWVSYLPALLYLFREPMMTTTSS